VKRVAKMGGPSSQMAQYNLILSTFPSSAFITCSMQLWREKSRDFWSGRTLIVSCCIWNYLFRSSSVLFFFTTKAQQSSSDSCLCCALLVHIYTNYFFVLTFLHEFYRAHKFYLGTGLGMPECSYATDLYTVSDQRLELGTAWEWG